MENIYNIQEAILAQQKYCKETGYPHFAPHNGICYRCNRNIYKEEKHTNQYNGNTYTTGITVEKAASELITGCPHCNRSYCD